MDELGAALNDFVKQDIKAQPLQVPEVDKMGELAGSFEALFSRRAQKYKSLGLAGHTLTESDYRSLILEEYTFLKRPVVIVDDKIFIGNSPSEIASLKEALG